ncbi:MAG: hypothetical protein ACQETC_08870 [Thermodesulfobacteriota bacterium]
MRITDLAREKQEDRTRISAKVEWEDCDEPRRDVFMETPDPYGESMALNPEAFLVGCIIPALHFGEKRIQMDHDICPDLLEGLETVMAVMKMWTEGGFRPLSLDVGTKRNRDVRKSRNRSAMVFSGGIDSIATLQLNRRRYPETHPGYIRDCLFIHGFDIGGVRERGMKYHVFDRAMAAMKKITDHAGAELIPVYTNIRHLCDERDLWLNRFFGAVLAASAHSFSERFDRFSIASSYDLANLGPCGSHPLLDPEYSSFDLAIRHRDVAWTRIDKIKLVSEWPVALSNMRVCLANVKDRLNCGKCEKCVRTMTGLVAAGALEKSEAFVENDVAPDLFDAFKITIRHREPFYEELLPFLRERGRDDLVDVIEGKLAEKQA